RAEAAGALNNPPVAFMHAGGNDDLGSVREQTFLNFEKFRNDADDLAAMIMDRARDRSHQADRTAAIDKPDPVGGEDFAKAPGRGNEARVMSFTGPAIDADSSDNAHNWVWHWATPGVKSFVSLAHRDSLYLFPLAAKVGFYALVAQIPDEGGFSTSFALGKSPHVDPSP